MYFNKFAQSNSQWLPKIWWKYFIKLQFVLGLCGQEILPKYVWLGHT